MSAQEFYNLTWWEWGMCQWEIITKHERRVEEWDFKKVLTGEFMALFATAHVKRPFTRNEFFKLSSELEAEVDPHLFEKVASRLGSTIKREDNGRK